MSDYARLLYNITEAYGDKDVARICLLRQIVCDIYHRKTNIEEELLSLFHITHVEYESLCGVCDIFINDLKGVKDENLAQGSDPDSSSKVSNSTMA